MKTQELSATKTSSGHFQEGRLSRCFTLLKSRGEHALIAYVTAGDPDMNTTYEAVLTLIRSGADIIEVGIPFSDPLLDGPVIQAASQRSLDGGTKISGVFNLIADLRKETDAPVIFMTCVNPIVRMGMRQFAQRCIDVGVDGVLITDLPPQEADEWVQIASAVNLDRIFMLAPTSSVQRIEQVSRVASGFIYCQSRTGVTGVQKEFPDDLGELTRRVKSYSELPIGVGFGISTPEHVRAVSSVAEGAVVGSAFVRLIGLSDRSVAMEQVARLAESLKKATRNSGSPHS